MWAELMELPWPTRCVGCDRIGAGILCKSCGPIGAFRLAKSLEGVIAIFASSRFDRGIARALKAAKYGPNRSLMVEIARRWADCIALPLQISGIQGVVPVPSPWRRRWRRGFEPTSLLAHDISIRLNRPVIHALRCRATTQLAGLEQRIRAHKLRGMFEASHSFQDERLLLVDDVMTSGATAEACARELLAAGAREVVLSVVSVASNS